MEHSLTQVSVPTSAGYFYLPAGPGTVVPPDPQLTRCLRPMTLSLFWIHGWPWGHLLGEGWDETLGSKVLKF